MDVDSLCSKPLLQSAYAETLRLYTSLFTLRSPAHEDFRLGIWKVPKDKLIAVDSRVAHMDSRFWNTGCRSSSNAEDDAEGPYPLNKFWTARFLEYDDDPTNGPLRFNPSKSKASAVGAIGDPVLGLNGNNHDPRFTMEGLTGAWLPFGGGPRQCPGRNFAKQEIIISFATIVASFEIESLEKDRTSQGVPDMKYYGLGTFPPKRKVPFRIRRRE